MTNATVTGIATAPGGHTVKVKFKTRIRFIVDAQCQVFGYIPAMPAMKPGVPFSRWPSRSRTVA
jgi:hypothetical protein